MARQESDREDLWAEAVTLTARAELRLPGRAEPVLIGRRPNGWWSIYFGQDTMLQFTSDGQVRRAFRDGKLFRTHGNTLAQLTRERTATETVLRRHDLSPEELDEFRAGMLRSLAELQSALKSKALVERLALPNVDRVGDDERANFLCEVNQFLQTVVTTDRFLAPPIRGKK